MKQTGASEHRTVRNQLARYMRATAKEWAGGGLLTD